MIEKATQSAPRSTSRELDFLGTALWVSAVVNALVPAALFSDQHLFGVTDLRMRIAVTVVVLAEYAAAYLLLVLHANPAFAAGYAVATSAVVTLGSAALTYLIGRSGDWHAMSLLSAVLVIAAFAIAVISNAVFFIAGVRYARFIHQRLHLGGFTLGMAVCLAALAALMLLLR